MGWQADRQVGGLAGKQTGRQASRWVAGRQVGGLAGKQAGRWVGWRQAGRRVGRRRQTERYRKADRQDMFHREECAGPKCSLLASAAGDVFIYPLVYWLGKNLFGLPPQKMVIVSSRTGRVRLDGRKINSYLSPRAG